MAESKQTSTTLAGFEILEKVGQGGMGAVYRARQKSMDRIVALKILPRRLAQDAIFKERFIREARTGAKLNHLNIISAIDCGEDSGYTYFAMEFVEGQTCQKLIKDKGPFTVAAAMPIIQQIAEALQYASDTANIIHRDIKPDNIMLTSDGIAKLCDLGLARSTEPEENASLTQTGMAVGTPHYISPEQARGEKEIDTRADLYSLGATFYHMLAGKTLFTAPTAASIMAQHLIEHAPAVNDENTDVQEDIAAIICKMLAKDRNDRYANCAELIKDLELVREGHPPAALNFKGKSSCAHPARSNRAARRVMSTTGPRVPVGARGVTTGPVSPVGGGRAAVRSAKQSASPAVLAGVGFASIVLLGLLFWASSGNSDQIPPQNTAQNNPAKKTVPTPAVEVKTAAPQLTAERKLSQPAPEPVRHVTPLVPEPAQPEPPEPPEPPALVQPALKPEPPTPVKPSSDQEIDEAQARFLSELVSRAKTKDLNKLKDELQILARNDEFKLAKDRTAEELKDLAAAAVLEEVGLEAIGQAKDTVNLPPDLAKLSNAVKAKVEKYEAGKGLLVKVEGGAILTLTTAKVSPDEIVRAAGNQAEVLPLAHYYFARGLFDKTLLHLPQLAESDRVRIGKKLDLLNVGEAEQQAKAAVAKIGKFFQSQQWKKVLEGIDAFAPAHGATKSGKESTADLASKRQIADEHLNPNPWLKVFHAKECKLRSGFVELYYDFSHPSQLQDWVCGHGKLQFGNGWMTVPPFGGEWSRAQFVAPITELQRLEAVGKTQQTQPVRLGVYFVPPGMTAQKCARLVFRPYNYLPHLEAWDGAQAKGPKAEDWRKDTNIVAARESDEFKWTVNGTVVGNVKSPETLSVFHPSFIGENGEHTWTKIRLVFKPEPAWAKQALEQAKQRP